MAPTLKLPLKEEARKPCEQNRRHQPPGRLAELRGGTHGAHCVPGLRLASRDTGLAMQGLSTVPKEHRCPPAQGCQWEQCGAHTMKVTLGIDVYFGCFVFNALGSYLSYSTARRREWGWK